jgi:hypothetical protein
MSFTKIPITGLSDNVVTQIQSGGGIPKITSIDYPGDDTAADPAGGQTITINGANFTNSSIVYIDGTQVGIVSYINANTLSFVSPAKVASSYALYVVNSDGATAISVPGISFSNSPAWSTSSGSLGSPYETASFSTSLSATGDGSVTYAVSSGNSLPSGLTLASNGYLSGTIPATDPTTTYTFYVDAIDSQNQGTSRSFSVTYNKDAVTWSSPANGASYSLGVGVSNTVTLEANSAAGKAITYTVQSGSLPANVSISGSSITGTPNTAQNNTAVVIRATAADTTRFADRTLYFLTQVSGWKAVNEYSYDNKLFNFDAGGIGVGLGISMSSDGTKLFIVTNADLVRSYTLSTPYDITSASFSTELNIASQIGDTPYGLFFSPDGTKMYISNYGANSFIYQWNLGTAWNISTASPITSSPSINFYIGGNNHNACNFYIKSDGTKVYVSMRGSGHKFRQYTMSTPWSISSLTYDNIEYAVTQDVDMYGIFFKSDGTKLTKFISTHLVLRGT